MDKFLEQLRARLNQLQADAQAMLDRIVKERWFTPKAVIGFWPAQSVGDDIRLYQGESRTETLATLQNENENHPDLADRASSETDRAIELRARDRQRKLIAKIDAALTFSIEVEGGLQRCEVLNYDEVRVAASRNTDTLCISAANL
jgi:RNA polymerase-binding protein DksA